MSDRMQAKVGNRIYAPKLRYRNAIGMLSQLVLIVQGALKHISGGA